MDFLVPLDLAAYIDWTFWLLLQTAHRQVLLDEQAARLASRKEELLAAESENQAAKQQVGC